MKGIKKNNKSTKYENECGRSLALMTEAVRDFGHYLIDNSENGVIYADEIPDYVAEFAERFE